MLGFSLNTTSFN